MGISRSLPSDQGSARLPNTSYMKSLFLASFSMLTAAAIAGGADSDPLSPWREGVKIRPVAPQQDRHSIHAYFNTCPESPDGKYVLYYTSGTATGEEGDLRILERS